MSDALKLVIVGPGRLGRSAARLLTDRGIRFSLVGRGEAIPDAPLTWLTVPDGEIRQAAQAVPLGPVVLHASGATDLEPLRHHRSAGSLHPLMTFPGPELALPTGTIPAAVAGDKPAVLAATELAHDLGFTPFEVSGDRALYHASAVLAGNFATVLLDEASRVLAQAGVPEEQAPALLAPLAIASIRNAAAVGPGAALTGPVARHDEDIIRQHLEVLAHGPPGTLETYEALLTAARTLRKRAETGE
jgi:predicted short-subunit dehydrogenase-like oxidoreductase (DUF2520 family)